MMSALKKKKEFISQLRHNFQGANHPKWLEFMTAFFESAPSSAFEDLAADHELKQQLKSAWDFFNKCEVGKISIFYKLDEIQGRLLLHVIQPDQPFLLETLKTHLSAHQLHAEEVFHPIFSVRRSKLGKLSDFSSLRGKAHDEFEHESLISLELNWTLSNRMIESFIDELRWRFDMLQLSIQEWPKMRQRIQKVIPKVQHPEWDYLDWLLQDNFIFVGYREFVSDKVRSKNGCKIVEESELGLFKDKTFRDHKSFKITNKPTSLEKFSFNLHKTPVRSPINRSARIDCIEVVDKKTNLIHQIIGIFTRRSYNASIFKIPILKRKAENIYNHFGLQRNWHDGKMLLQAIESIPHDEFWDFSEQELTELCGKAIGFHEKSLPIFICKASSDKISHTLLTFVGRDRYSVALKELIGKKLAEEFGGVVSSTRGIVDDAPFARLIYVIDSPSKALTHDTLDPMLTECSLSWDEKRLRISQKKPARDSFVGVFTPEYQHDFSPEQAVTDCEILHSLGIRSNYGLLFNISEGVVEQTFASRLSLRIFSLNIPLQLSLLLNILDNFGIKVFQEKTYELKNGLYYLHHCVGAFASDIKGDEVGLLQNLNVAIEHTLNDEHPNDGFNLLYTTCGMDRKQVHYFRAMHAFMRQIKYTYGEAFTVKTLSEYPHVTKVLLQLFEARFDLNLSSTTRAKIISDLKSDLSHFLEKITEATKDQFFRDVLELIDATVRTNYYQEKDYLSFKFESIKLSKAQDPKPLYETFVFASQIEGVHLRTSRVARGGIRYSDRLQDYRTEVLQLMQAQDLKNSIIVPSGAKGGFVVKKRSPSHEEVVECYKLFIRGILDLADNQKNGEIIPPKNVLCYDPKDPYIVVAADKGTAKFSDTANEIAAEYDFWLGDAFASGGSYGYDHKKLGITAKGAFVSINHHFHKIGIKLGKNIIRTVGVGDMSGDVFGNGMLIYENMSLIAAFNHKHIFIDPSPNVDVAYLERKRLFEMPGSQWSDYNPSLISSGGGVFKRDEKLLNVSSEIQNLFGVDAQVTPDTLIQAILGAEVDLLWFGGIGTFIKADDEVFSGDAFNDSIRIPASSVKASVIGEGANLAVTPLARIQLGQKGVFINSDAVDNAGGVNCSDHEVNLKILIGTTSNKARNNLLNSLSDDICKNVLQDNKKQNIALDIMESQAQEKHESFCKLISFLEEKGILNRKIVSLDKAEYLIKQRSSLTRPEMAVVLSYAKNWLQNEVLRNYESFEGVAHHFVSDYFPATLKEKFNLNHHLLFREIAALSITNDAINFVGPLWFLEYPDFALKRLRLFSMVFDQWGLRKHVNSILNGQPSQVVPKLDLIRRILTQSLPFVSDKGMAQFQDMLKHVKAQATSGIDYSDYPYILGISGEDDDLDSFKFFDVLKNEGMQSFYEFVFTLPEEQSWQVMQKERLIQQLFNVHAQSIRLQGVDLIRKLKEKLVLLETQDKPDYGFVSYLLSN